jgi:glycosyltransferase involved in cell wall biosynthesis
MAQVARRSSSPRQGPSAAVTVQPFTGSRSSGARDLRILVASHGHPSLTKGGAEIAAYELYTHLAAQPFCEAWFLGCTAGTDVERTGAAISQPFSEREFVYTVSGFDWFNFANRDRRLGQDLEAVIKQIRPDIIHFHHYVNFGVEIFSQLRRWAPEAKIIVTLHEYLAICHHYGQMICSETNTLCYRESFLKCKECFPNLDVTDFFLRKNYIQRFLGEVDRFITPSHFLRDRYIAWGLSSTDIEVIENVVRYPRSTEMKQSRSRSSGQLTLGFFGQISFLKGINILFDAAQILDEAGVTEVFIEIHGDSRSQPAAFKEDFQQRLSRAGKNVRFVGPYEQDRVDELMKGVDVVVVPSIWWENSPVVIQEAYRNRRPVICSDIGGMAEKVRHGLDGFHFPVGNAPALCDLVKSLTKDRTRLTALDVTLQSPPSPDDIVARHIDLYLNLSAATPNVAASQTIGAS